TARAGGARGSPSPRRCAPPNGSARRPSATAHERRPPGRGSGPRRDPPEQRGGPGAPLVVLEGETRRGCLPAVFRLSLLPDARGEAAGRTTTLPRRRGGGRPGRAGEPRGRSRVLPAQASAVPLPARHGQVGVPRLRSSPEEPGRGHVATSGRPVRPGQHEPGDAAARAR